MRFYSRVFLNNRKALQRQILQVFLCLWQTSLFAIDQSGLAIAPTSAFSSYPFVLWDYAEDIQASNPSSGATHWEDLLTFISGNTIVRLITNVKSPKEFPFFSANQTSSSFVSYAEQLPATCELAVLFDLSDFTWDSQETPTPSPSNLPVPYPPLPSYFNDLPLKMEWVRHMIALGINIQEVVLDPEASGHSSVEDYQLLINFMDYFRTVNNMNVRLAVTYGIEGRTPTYANLDTFPTDRGLIPLPGNFPPLSQGYSAPELRSSSTNSLLDHVYVQAYEPDMPYIFTLLNNPSLAASSLLHNFRDEPYVQGIGTISFSTTSKAVLGKNTYFLTGDPRTNLLKVTEDMPIGIKESGNIIQIGIVSENVPITNEALSLNSPPPIERNDLLFYQTEIINKWGFPFTNPAVVNKIYIMFSFENLQNNQNPFFGTWSTDQFMNFIDSLYNQGQIDLPIYKQDTDTAIPLPRNFVLYDFNIFRQNVSH